MKFDPSLEGGYIQIHQHQLNMTIKSTSLDFQDKIMVRVFTNSLEYKLQLTSQLNISFFYQMHISFKNLYQKQGVEGRQNEVKWWKDIFKEDKQYLFKLQSLQQAILTINYHQKYKKYLIAELQLKIGSQKMLRQSLMYRYQRMIARQKMLDSHLQNIVGIIKMKNPSLLLNFDNKMKKNVFK